MRKVLMCGTGEYSTGYIPGSEAAPDKKKGVVGLVLFDLRRRGKLSQVGCVGVNGKKFPEIRKHLQVAIAECYKDMDVTMDTWPGDSEVNPEAYKTAIDSLQKGDGAIIFTPDDTHFDITLYAIKKGIHVLVTKPVVKTVKEHLLLIQAAREHKVHVQIEYHKRWDQIYADARERIRDMGDFTFFQSYMSQPQKQLVTFKAWAGKSSDISYYLNSHHMDWHCWAMDGRAVPTKVTAFGSTGVADAQFGCPNGTEDSISVMAEWQNSSGTKGTAVYTSCWTAPDNAEVHSQQRFMCVAHKGEVRADQAHRGYEVTTDGKYSSVNPLYMKYTKGGWVGGWV
eukprot:Cvel_17604.t1-p1 / transcript=Cvel_17604.t1 / gene=Cvel_17604 / organism=Chromera_velia_CCMP2878 / gene_product=hypothetical protein / transcript_product=hypothetical protein / location=Cvel_scaffold1415:45301-46596(+) / protein_length=338 / sequence_SO=supercontig / SO=protein_coding / is_pseudo=false